MLGSATGRGTTWFVQLQQTQGALRHYRRGGLFGKLVADSYGFTGWEKTRSYQEFMLLNHLRDAGVTCRADCRSRTKHGLLYKADLLSEKVPNARDLVSILQEARSAMNSIVKSAVRSAKCTMRKSTTPILIFITS